MDKTLDGYQLVNLVYMATLAMRRSTENDLLAGIVDVLSDGLTPDDIADYFAPGSYADLDRIARALEAVDRPDNPFVLAARAWPTDGDPCSPST